MAFQRGQKCQQFFMVKTRFNFMVKHSLLWSKLPFFVLRLWSQNYLVSLVWHSKADKIVNNFHGPNWLQLHGQTLIFMIKTDIFVLRSWSQDFLISLHSIPMTKSHAQNLFQNLGNIEYCGASVSKQCSELAR